MPKGLMIMMIWNIAVLSTYAVFIWAKVFYVVLKSGKLG